MAKKKSQSDDWRRYAILNCSNKRLREEYIQQLRSNGITSQQKDQQTQKDHAPENKGILIALFFITLLLKLFFEFLPKKKRLKQS